MRWSEILVHIKFWLIQFAILIMTRINLFLKLYFLNRFRFNLARITDRGFDLDRVRINSVWNYNVTVPVDMNLEHFMDWNFGSNWYGLKFSLSHGLRRFEKFIRTDSIWPIVELRIEMEWNVGSDRIPTDSVCNPYNVTDWYGLKILFFKLIQI